MRTKFTADDKSKKYKACKLDVTVAKVNFVLIHHLISSFNLTSTYMLHFLSFLLDREVPTMNKFNYMPSMKCHMSKPAKEEHTAL